MMDPEAITSLWVAIRSVAFLLVWIIPILWIVSVIDAVVLNELVPLAIAWILGKAHSDKEYIRGAVKMRWDDVILFVGYAKKLAMMLAFIYLFARIADSMMYVLGVD